jgi:hypothetical protein
MKRTIIMIPIKILALIIPRGDRRHAFLDSYSNDIDETHGRLDWIYSLWLAGANEALTARNDNKSSSYNLVHATTVIVLGIGFLPASKMLLASGACAFVLELIISRRNRNLRGQIQALLSSSLILYLTFAADQLVSFGKPQANRSPLLYISVLSLVVVLSYQLKTIASARDLLLGDANGTWCLAFFSILQVVLTVEFALVLLAANNGVLAIAADPLSALRQATSIVGFVSAALAVAFAAKQRVRAPMSH